MHDRRRTVRLGPPSAGANREIGRHPLSDGRGRIRKCHVCVSGVSRRERLPFSQGIQSAGALGTTLRHGRRLGRPAPPVHEGDRGERGRKGRGLQLRIVVSRPRLGHRFCHLPMGRAMVGAAKGVCRGDEVEIRAESLAAHAAGLVDVEQLAHGAANRRRRVILPRQPARQRPGRRRYASPRKPIWTRPPSGCWPIAPTAWRT